MVEHTDEHTSARIPPKSARVTGTAGTANADDIELALSAAHIKAERAAGGWPEEIRYMVALEQVATACAAIKNVGQADAHLTTVVGTDRRTDDGTFHIAYIFSIDSLQRSLTVETCVPAERPEFPSVTPFVTAAHWHERELQDMFGLRAVGHPDPRRLVLHENYPRDFHPLRKDVAAGETPPFLEGRPFTYPRVEGEGVFDVPVGPIHAGVIEPGRFLFSVVGEAIFKLEARLFFTHRGIEKLAEGRTALHGLFSAERICGVCAFSHSTAYAQAIESLAGTPAPPRAQAIRTIMLELERLYNHIGDAGNICAGIGFAVGTSSGARLKERLQRLNEAVAGHRFLRGVNTLGGVRLDLHSRALKLIEGTIKEVDTDFKQMVELMLGTDSVVERLKGTGVLGADIVREFGAVGVAARASGLARDSRVYRPHALYPDLSFKVPKDDRGDVYARTSVRIHEVVQSVHLIRQLVENMPPGPVIAPLGPLPAYKGALGVTESPRGETAHWVMLNPDGTIFRYHVRSAPYANWPVVPFTVPGNMVPDFPLINKSFELCYACCDR